MNRSELEGGGGGYGYAIGHGDGANKWFEGGSV